MNLKKSHPALNDMTWNSSMTHSQYMYPQWVLYMSKYIIFCLEIQILQRLAVILWVSKGYNVKYTHFEQDPNPSPLLAVCPWASIQLTSTVLDNNLGFLLLPITSFSQLQNLCQLQIPSFSWLPFISLNAFSHYLLKGTAIVLQLCKWLQRVILLPILLCCYVLRHSLQNSHSDLCTVQMWVQFTTN